MLDKSEAKQTAWQQTEQLTASKHSWKTKAQTAVSLVYLVYSKDTFLWNLRTDNAKSYFYWLFRAPTRSYENTAGKYDRRRRYECKQGVIGKNRSHNQGRRPWAPAISSIGVGPMIWDNFSVCAIACGTRAYIAARIFADVAQGKWRPKFPKSFMLLAHNSTPLWLLEFCLSIFAVSCSSLIEDSAELRYVRSFISLIKLNPLLLLQELHITPI